MEENRQLTPTGRIPGTPLPNIRHELIADATVRGKSCVESGLYAGYRPGPGLKGNVARLRQTPAIRERIAEIAARGAELAEVHAAWVLADAALFARSSLAKFFRRDEAGALVLDGRGQPIIDFSGADHGDLRALKKMKPGKYGTEYEVHDPLPYLDRLGRYLGLWSGEATAVAQAAAAAGASDPLTALLQAVDGVTRGIPNGG